MESKNIANLQGYLVRKIASAVCGIITPDGKDELYRRAFSQVSQYELPYSSFCTASRPRWTQTGRTSILQYRRTIWSSFVHKRESRTPLSGLGFGTFYERGLWTSSCEFRIPSLQVIQCIPSASLHYINLAKNYNKGGFEFGVKYKRERFDKKKNDRFIEFLTTSVSNLGNSWFMSYL